MKKVFIIGGSILAGAVGACVPFIIRRKRRKYVSKEVEAQD